MMLLLFRMVMSEGIALASFFSTLLEKDEGKQNTSNIRVCILFFSSSVQCCHKLKLLNELNKQALFFVRDGIKETVYVCNKRPMMMMRPPRENRKGPMRERATRAGHCALRSTENICQFLEILDCLHCGSTRSERNSTDKQLFQFSVWSITIERGNLLDLRRMKLDIENAFHQNVHVWNGGVKLNTLEN
jgi:hypothetical protein